MVSFQIDCLQYAHWSEKVFKQMSDANLDAVHVTIGYHETFREAILNLEKWYDLFESYPDYIFQGFSARDIEHARTTNRTAIFFGFQNPSPLDGDIGLIEVWYKLGVRFMQLTYNNQSILASGCYENTDTGLTRMGREVVNEMNRLGMAVDMSHSGEKSTLEAIEFSSKPIAITHANPYSWHPARRNVSNEVLVSLSAANGMLGFSLYPHHLKNNSECTLIDFCAMIYDTAEIVGINNVGIGSDLCQDQPDSVVKWMREGCWTKSVDFGEGSKSEPGFPKMPEFYRDNRDFKNIAKGLRSVGMNKEEIEKVVGGNWFKFFSDSF